MSTTIPPASVQLYSLREASAADFDGVLEQLARIGMQGVEPFNLFGKTPEAFKKQVNDLGMQVSSSHFPWANRTEDINEVVETVQALGLSRAAGGFGPDDFKDLEAVKRTIEITQGLVDALKPHGVSLCLHNHFWEYALIDGQPGYYYLQDAVTDVEFEIDAYWAANFGARDPAEEIRRVANRTPLVHIKDGPLEKQKANLSVGTGAMNIPALFEAMDPETIEWAIIEFDACDTDMMTAVADSHRYLTFNNLAR